VFLIDEKSSIRNVLCPHLELSSKSKTTRRGRGKVEGGHDGPCRRREASARLLMVGSAER